MYDKEEVNLKCNIVLINLSLNSLMWLAAVLDNQICITHIKNINLKSECSQEGIIDMDYFYPSQQCVVHMEMSTCMYSWE